MLACGICVMELTGRNEHCTMCGTKISIFNVVSSICMAFAHTLFVNIKVMPQLLRSCGYPGTTNAIFSHQLASRRRIQPEKRIGAAETYGRVWD